MNQKTLAGIVLFISSAFMCSVAVLNDLSISSLSKTFVFLGILIFNIWIGHYRKRIYPNLDVKYRALLFGCGIGIETLTYLAIGAFLYNMWKTDNSQTYVIMFILIMLLGIDAKQEFKEYIKDNKI